MSSFCGEFPNATSISKGVLGNECFVDGLSFVPQILFILIAVPLLIVWNKSQLGKLHAKTWVHFPGHEVRWIATFVLVAANLAEFGEGLISDSLYEGTHLHVFLPHLVCILGSMTSIVFYHYTEMWNSPRFLLILLLYWSASLMTKFLALINQMLMGVTSMHMKLHLTVLVILLYGLMVLVELYLLNILVSFHLFVSLYSNLE